MLQEDACRSIQMTQNERICMETGQYPGRTSATFIVNRRQLSWFGHVSRHDTKPKIIQQGTVNGRHHRGRLRKSWKDIKEWTGQSLTSLLYIADDRSR